MSAEGSGVGKWCWALPDDDVCQPALPPRFSWRRFIECDVEASDWDWRACRPRCQKPDTIRALAKGGPR